MSERTADTVEEIEALPVGTIARDRDGDAWQRKESGWTLAGTHYDFPSQVLFQTAPLTVLTPEHIHDWKPSGRSLLGVVETCADDDCGISQYAPIPAGAAVASAQLGGPPPPHLHDWRLHDRTGPGGTWTEKCADCPAIRPLDYR